MREVITSALLLIGGTFMLLAAVGVVRMPDIYSRLSAAAKGNTLGLGFLLAAAAVHFGELGVTSHAILIIAFVMLTTPVSAHLIGRAAYFIGVPLWEGTTRDDLRGRYDPDTHSLASAPSPSASGQVPAVGSSDAQSPDPADA
jgi:multicomponent Na+:H+ antiporter subunit G